MQGSQHDEPSRHARQLPNGVIRSPGTGDPRSVPSRATKPHRIKPVNERRFRLTKPQHTYALCNSRHPHTNVQNSLKSDKLLSSQCPSGPMPLF